MHPPIIVFSTKGSHKAPLIPAQSYSPTQWEENRALITRLYRDEARTLQQVRHVLAQNNFHPTQAMLKKRIKKWDLDKNHKEADMLHALKLATERAKHGKDTEFVIRGRLVSFADIQRYFKRKDMTDLLALANETDHIPPPTTEVRPQTPRPQINDTGSTAHRPALFLSPYLQPDLPSWNAPSSPAEHILRGTQGFIQAYKDDHLREFEAEHPLHSLLRLVAGMFWFADDIIRCGGAIPTAFKLFGACFDLMCLLRRCDMPILVPWFCSFLCHEWDIASREVITRLFGFIVDLIDRKLLLRSQRLEVVRLILSSWILVPIEERCETASRALDVLRSDADRKWPYLHPKVIMDIEVGKVHLKERREVYRQLARMLPALRITVLRPNIKVYEEIECVGFVAKGGRLGIDFICSASE